MLVAITSNRERQLVMMSIDKAFIRVIDKNQIKLFELFFKVIITNQTYSLGWKCNLDYLFQNIHS